MIDSNAQSSLFPNGEDPVGEVIMLGKVPVRIIGVVETQRGFGPGNNQANVYVPYTTAMDRILGRSYLSQIIVRVADSADMDVAQGQIELGDAFVDLPHRKARAWRERCSRIRVPPLVPCSAAAAGARA